ncbi:MAG: Crp/Fnr family transcriptional regulator [Thermoanaerobaculia bacterium]|nr:Crp/Fnr family transcriptional regulator [Thermoanaerobaculia bacterium]
MVPTETLREIPYFKWGSEDSLATLSMVSEEVAFAAGEELFKKGDPAEYLYVITEGEVDIQYALASGDRRTVDQLSAGDLVVWSAVVEPHVCTAFGVARTDVRAIAVEAARLRQLLHEDGELYHSLMSRLVKVVTGRLTGARRQLAALPA